MHEDVPEICVSALHTGQCAGSGGLPGVKGVPEQWLGLQMAWGNLSPPRSSGSFSSHLK